MWCVHCAIAGVDLPFLVLEYTQHADQNKNELSVRVYFDEYDQIRFSDSLAENQSLMSLVSSILDPVIIKRVVRNRIAYLDDATRTGAVDIRC